MIRVLFVCTGNICRSPTAEGVFRKLVQDRDSADRITCDSAGTHSYHVGEPPDARSQIAAKKRGVDLSGLRGRVADSVDFDRFDYVLAMDRQNFQVLKRLAPPDQFHKLSLFLDFPPHKHGSDIPDPYYGDGDGFENVLDLVEAASEGLYQHISDTNF